ncbi:MAG: hypothetical protein ABIF82_07955 [Planctomycetota bacterium]
MAQRENCKHQGWKYLFKRRPGKMSSIKLWYCPSCGTTIDVSAVPEPRTRSIAA